MTQTSTVKSLTTPDGVTLRYEEAGSGDPPLLFVHGWCCNHSYWRDQIPAFSGDHRVVAVDLRGHGESDKPDQDYTINGFADDVAWLIGEAGLQRPVVIGHSMGGVIALKLARSNSRLARAVVMIDSPLAPLPDNLQPVAQQVFAGLQSPAYAGVAAGFVRMQMFNADSPEGLVEEVVSGMASGPQRVMHTALMSTISADAAPPGGIPVPAMYIRAATQYASEDELIDRYPGLKVVTVDCAHFVQMERPEETNRLIEEFLGGLS